MEERKVPQRSQNPTHIMRFSLFNPFGIFSAPKHVSTSGRYKLKGRLDGHLDGINCLAVSLHGGLLASGGKCSARQKHPANSPLALIRIRWFEDMEHRKHDTSQENTQP